MSVAIIIFAKAPRAGLAKTRLIPALGAGGAARLAGRMLEHAVQQALETGVEHIELCVTPDASHPAFQALAGQYGERLAFSQQGEGDLGARMYGALARTLRDHDRVLLMGTDAPALTAHVLSRANQALLEHDAVFVPAMDGGYAMAGLRQAHEPLFSNMPWSTPAVMPETRQRLRALGCSWHELPAVADIDEPADIIHVPEGWSGLSSCHFQTRPKT